MASMQAIKPQLPLMDLDTEIVIPHLEIDGDFPGWLCGTLIRNGPAKFHFSHGSINHWFDGMAMLHAFTFNAGKVGYRNKFLHSSPYLQAKKNGTTHFEGFMQDPCTSLFRRLFTHYFPYFLPPSMLNTNVNITKIGNDFVALTETPLPIRFDRDTLETLGALEYEDSLPKRDIFESAHPLHDPDNQEQLNYFVDFSKQSKYKIYRIKEKSTTREVFCEIEVSNPAYMHSFSITPRYFILVEYPLRINPLDLFIKGGGFITNFKWDSSQGTLFHVVERVTGRKVKTFETEGFFSFHHVNAFEQGGDVILDLIAYPDPSIVYGAPPEGQIRKLQRFTLPMTTENIRRHTIAETFLELPRLNETQDRGKPYQYVLGVNFPNRVDGDSDIGLLKIDVQSSFALSWSEAKCWAGEPVFVPHPHAQEKSVILSLVLNNQKNNSFLLVLDTNLNELARAEIPLAIPYGLHGVYY